VLLGHINAVACHFQGGADLLDIYRADQRLVGPCTPSSMEQHHDIIFLYLETTLVSWETKVTLVLTQKP
jgi:hypothetical protein